MEDDHHHYGNISDLRQLINGQASPYFPTTDHHSLNIPAPSSSGGDGASSRWPRQETLTLVDIRSRLHPNFKQANHKGPLWDQVSRVMCSEHGYQRSGKKCREKFENLYKYYKKTKEGKAGRQDGKHYRFFPQLEALYGDTTTTTTTTMNEPETESWNGEWAEKRRKRGMKDFMDAQIRKVMEKQEGWVEKMVRRMEQSEEERVGREDQWRAQQAARAHRQRAQWATERAWIASRHAALMDILHNIKATDWSQPEITTLIHLTTSSGNSNTHEQLLWDEISTKMSTYGYQRSGSMCKDKWEAINYHRYLNNKTNHQNSTTSNYNILINGPFSEMPTLQPNNDAFSPSTPMFGSSYLIMEIPGKPMLSSSTSDGQDN